MSFPGMLLYNPEPQFNDFDNSDPAKKTTQGRTAGGKPVVTKKKLTMKHIELGRLVASGYISKETRNSQETILNHQRKSRYKEKIDV